MSTSRLAALAASPLISRMPPTYSEPRVINRNEGSTVPFVPPGIGAGAPPFPAAAIPGSARLALNSATTSPLMRILGFM